MKINKIILLSFIFLFILANPIYAANTTTSQTGCNIDVELINQNPYPASPGDYVDVVFQVTGVYNTDCEGARFKILTEYPFSVDDNITLKTINSSTWVQDYNKNWMVPYTLKVDKDAVEGENEIKVGYAPGTWGDDYYNIGTFNITIEDLRTDFDAIIQDVSESEVSIAIANIGKYIAESVIVKIPDQEYFQASGTNGQMVGNLENGDYTIVGFTISEKRNESNFNMSRNFGSESSQINNLTVEIYYTDGIGERRMITLDMPLDIRSFSTSNITASGMPQRSSSSSKWIIVAVVLVVIVAGAFMYKRYHKKRATHKTSNGIPDWIKRGKRSD